MCAKQVAAKKAVVKVVKPAAKTVQKAAPKTAVTKQIVMRPKVQTAEGWKRATIKARSKSKK